MNQSSSVHPATLSLFEAIKMPNRVGVVLFAAFLAIAASSTILSQAQTPATEPMKLTPKPIPTDQRFWRTTIAKLPSPAKGCHKATYPSLQWTAVPCSAVPARIMQAPRTVTRTIGNGVDDFAAQVAPPLDKASSGIIELAEGSFDKVTVTGETNVSIDGVRTRASEYSLQLNTNFFSSPMCSASANRACMGWEQFVFSNDPGSPPSQLFIQYWLKGFGPCPQNWSTSGNNCALTSSITSVPTQSIPTLANLFLTAKVETNGTDTVILIDPDGNAYSSTSDSALTLSPKWTQAEFNVFGDLTLHDALFDANSSLVVRTHVEIVKGHSSTEPIAAKVNLTGETNSLSLVTPACAIGSPDNAITFEETNVAGAKYTCPSPQVSLCKDAEELVSFEQKALANAQSALKTPSCRGGALFVCDQRIKAIQKMLQAAEAEKAKSCP